MVTQIKNKSGYTRFQFRFVYIGTGTSDALLPTFGWPVGQFIPGSRIKNSLQVLVFVVYLICVQISNGLWNSFFSRKFWPGERSSL